MSADLRDRLLACIRRDLAVCETAPEEPWSFSPQRGKQGHCFLAQVWDSSGDSLGTIESTAPEMASATARFIAAARTGWPAALRAMEAAVELHERVPVTYTAAGSSVGCCKVCGDKYSARTAWPCPTLLRLAQPWAEELGLPHS